jgi:hypothetical protein
LTPSKGKTKEIEQDKLIKFGDALKASATVNTNLESGTK